MSSKTVIALLLFAACAPKPITGNEKPAATFSAQTSALTLSVDASGSTGIAFSWDFGDGATASGLTATHDYASAGTFTVTLSVTTEDGAKASATKQLTLTAPPRADPPTATVKATPTSGDAPLRVVFDSTGTTNAASYAWAFGDGQTSTEPKPVHTYQQAGEYTATLTVASADGQTATAQQPITAFGAASYTVTQTTQAPRVDADLSEWANVPGVTIADADYDGPGTASSLTFKLLWDDTNLYAAFDVTDTQVIANATATTHRTSGRTTASSSTSTRRRAAAPSCSPATSR